MEIGQYQETGQSLWQCLYPKLMSIFAWAVVIALIYFFYTILPPDIKHVLEGAARAIRRMG